VVSIKLEVSWLILRQSNRVSAIYLDELIESADGIVEHFGVIAHVFYIFSHKPFIAS
jgi:hypothetical protein